MTNEQGRKEWGFSLGSFINTNIKGTIDKPFNEYITTHKPMYMHEYGHYLLSQKQAIYTHLPLALVFLQPNGFMLERQNSHREIGYHV